MYLSRPVGLDFYQRTPFILALPTVTNIFALQVVIYPLPSQFIYQSINRISLCTYQYVMGR